MLRKNSRLNSIYGPYLLNVISPVFFCFILGHLSHPPTNHNIYYIVEYWLSIVMSNSKVQQPSLVEIIAIQFNGKCMNVIFCLYMFTRALIICSTAESIYADDNLELFHLIRPIYIFFLHPKSNKPSTSRINIIFLFPFFSSLLLNFPVDSFNIIPSYQINCYFFRNVL